MRNARLSTMSPDFECAHPAADLGGKTVVGQAEVLPPQFEPALRHLPLHCRVNFFPSRSGLQLSAQSGPYRSWVRFAKSPTTSTLRVLSSPTQRPRNVQLEAWRKRWASRRTTLPRPLPQRRSAPARARARARAELSWSRLVRAILAICANIL